VRAAAALLALTAACAVPDLSLAPDTLIDEGPGPLSNDPMLYVEFHGAGGADSYACTLDGSAPFACESPVAAAISDGEHVFTVAASLDGSPDTTPARIHWRIDLVPPETTMLLGPPGLTGSTDAQLWFGGSDNLTTTGDLRYECALDGGVFAPCASPATLHLPDAGEDLEHFVFVHAVDEAGNIDVSPIIFQWEVDTRAPDTIIIDESFTSPLDGETTGPSVLFEFTSSESDFGFSQFECSLDNGAFTPCFGGINYFIQTDGTHTFAARAIDSVGNVDPTPATRTWTVNTQYPGLTLTQKPPIATTDAATTFAWTSFDPAPVTSNCVLDNMQLVACASPLDLGALDLGAHFVFIELFDRFGNESNVQYAWEIDP
jgi:hypothetical protein